MPVMSCKHRALLIVTRDVQGTASHVAKRRIEFGCDEAEGHVGPHRNGEHGESWTDRGDVVTHILRHESDEA
jgi:hypothetical protein